jgi:hypothetical protein
LAIEGENQKFKFTEGCLYYLMGDSEGACLSWLLFLFFKMQNRHGNISFDLTDGLMLKKTRELIHTQFAKYDRKFLLLNLQTLLLRD